MASRLNWLRIKSFSCPPVVSNLEQTVLPWQDQSKVRYVWQGGYPRWRDGRRLSKFIQDTTENTYVTFDNLKEWYNRLKGIHEAFSKVAENMDRTRDFIASFFLFRSHSAYLAGVKLALSGQIPEAYMVLRGTLECALYGLYVARKASVREIWLRRDEDEEAKKKVRQEFKVGNILKMAFISLWRLSTGWKLSLLGILLT
jgi:hypothetical protein